MAPPEPSDLAVIGTAEDAMFAKFATVQTKYYQDPFLEYFLPVRTTSVPPTQQQQQQPRGPRRIQPQQPIPLPPQQHQHHYHHQRHTQPIIKRGTHARVCCMDRAILSAIESVVTTAANDTNQSPPRLMVVCLGSGKDTTFFRFHAGLLQGQESATTTKTDYTHVVDWYEIDHPAVTLEKIQMIQQSPLLCNEWKIQPQLIQPQQSDGGGCSFGLVDSKGHIRCHLIGHDLRQPPHQLVQKLRQGICHSTSSSNSSNISNKTTAPPAVLFTMECVQMYIPEHASRNLWRTLATAFPNSCLCIYDAMIGDDPFGRMMEHNLIEAGVVAYVTGDDGDNDDHHNNKHNNTHNEDNNHNSTSSLLETRTLQAQMTKLVECGWNRVVGCDMWNAYQSVITMEQRRHANRCEFLDEVEEWMLIMKHYSVIIATADNRNSKNGDEAGAWGARFCQVGTATSSSSTTTSPMGFQPNLCLVMTSNIVQPPSS